MGLRGKGGAKCGVLVLGRRCFIIYSALIINDSALFRQLMIINIDVYTMCITYIGIRSYTFHRVKRSPQPPWPAK